jgi:hypothetical protein
MTTTPTTRIAATLWAAMTLVILLAAACAAPAPSTPAPTSPAPTTPTPTPPGPTLVPTPAVSLPPFACGEAVGRPGTVPVARISGLAIANEAGLGRITFTFRPAGNVAAIPQVEIRPGTPPFTLDPSGLPLDVAGASFLVITLQGGTALDEEYNPSFAGPFDATPDGSPIVEVRRAGDFEAVSSWVVGLDGPACVRILPFDGTSRLVLELSTN